MDPESSYDGCVIAFCYLPEQNSVYSGPFQELAQELHLQKLQLVLFTSTYDKPFFQESKDTDFEFIEYNIPLRLSDYGTSDIYPYAHIVFNGIGAVRTKILAVEKAWENGQHRELKTTSLLGHANLLSAESFWLETFNTLLPRAVLTWGSTTSLSMLIRQICLEQCIPVHMIERGVLPDSLTMESGAQFALSDLYDLEFAEPDSENYTFEDYAQAIGNLLNKYPATTVAVPQTSSLPSPEKKHVLFLGSYTLAAGAYPPAFHSIAIQNYAYKNQEEVFELVSNFCSQNEIPFYAKSHPADLIQCNHPKLLNNSSIDELVAWADVVVCMHTNVTIRVLASNKFCILCAPSYLHNRGVAYQAENAAALVNQLHLTMQLSSPPEAQIAARKQFLRYFFKRRHFVPINRVSSIAPQSFADIAVKLGRYPHAHDPTGHSSFGSAQWEDYKRVLEKWGTSSYKNLLWQKEKEVLNLKLQDLQDTVSLMRLQQRALRRSLPFRILKKVYQLLKRP